MVESYPLHWPAGWPRTPPGEQKPGAFQMAVGKAMKELLREVAALGGRYPVVSSNISVRRDGLPYANQARQHIQDPGVAVYFERNGRQLVFACDKFDEPWKNIRAIGKTLEAIRGIERWGASDMMERSLSAFVALPAPKSCWDILGVKPGASEAEITAAYRSKARSAHPDHGGSSAAMVELSAARDEAVRARIVNA